MFFHPLFDGLKGISNTVQDLISDSFAPVLNLIGFRCFLNAKGLFEPINKRVGNILLNPLVYLIKYL